MTGRYQPSKILIEDACCGSALISQLEKDGVANVLPVTPRKSKQERFAKHLLVLKKRRVRLRSGAVWLGEATTQFLQFPNGPDDQVDALTQFLDFVATKPTLKQVLPNNRGSIGVAHYSKPSAHAPYLRGAVLVPGRSSIYNARVVAPPHHSGWGKLSDYYKN